MRTIERSWNERSAMSDPVISARPDTIGDEREFLLRSLRDLEAEHAAGDIDAADYARLRDDYTARAAAALRATDTPDTADPIRAADLPVQNPKRRRTKGLAVGAAIAVFAIGAGFALARSAGERVAGANITGAITESSTDRITQAQVLASQGKVLDAIKLYDRVLKEDPANPVALAQRGWLVSRAGLIDEGLAAIDKAIAAEPTYPDAHFFKAMILWRDRKQPAAAVAEFQAVIDNNPSADLASTVNALKAQAESASTESSTQP
jgi:tetratricopeptide (TPR) repeat protein